MNDQKARDERSSYTVRGDRREPREGIAKTRAKIAVSFELAHETRDEQRVSPRCWCP